MGPDSQPAAPRVRVLLAAAVAGLVLRLAFGLGYWIDKPMTRDEQEYLSLARSVTAGRGFVYDEVVLDGGQEPFGRAPGYPLFLALIGGGATVPRAVPDAVTVAQSLVGALGVLLIGVVAARFAGPAGGLAAAWLAAVYPPLVWVPAYALTEALYWPVGLGVVALLHRALDDPAGRHRWWLACGALTGVAILIRPATLLFAPLAIGWLVWRRGLVPAVALTIGLALLVGPWTLRNVAHYGRLVVVASEGGVTFWTGNHPLAIGDGDLAANPQLKASHQALRARYPGLTEEELEPTYYREALAWMGAHPLDWLRLELRKVFYLVVPVGPSYTLHSTRYVVASVLAYLTVLPLALYGAWSLRARWARVPGLWLLLGSAIAVSLIFFPQERFRIPIIDPVLIVCAGGAWTRLTGADA